MVTPEKLRGLKSVRVDKEFLLGKLKDNRDKHRAIFEDALEGWHKRVLENLEEQLALAKADKLYQPRWTLPMPQDHTADYNRAIDLLEASLDQEFELSDTEFSQYVRDDWGWKFDFMTTISGCSYVDMTKYE